MYSPKPLFEERMKALLESPEDYEKFLEYAKLPLPRTIRCNTLKISAQELKQRLEEKGWKIRQPFPEYPEIMIVESVLQPGELGKSIEHVMGYYYIQEMSSMMPVIALQPKPGEIVLDLCAAPGSKTTQMSAFMQNAGTIIANDNRIDRIQILASNLERCGCMNVIVTRNDGVQLCERLAGAGMKFDKILVDAPCSAEGNVRSNQKTLLMWNIRMIEKLGRMQKKLALSAFQLLKEGGEMVYSTCTHAPEENEAVVDFLVKNFNAQSEKISLPLKCRQGITEWGNGKLEFSQEIKSACRIYPQDSNTEGFFVAKVKKGV
ncbi:MAG: RNA methylase, NOL1/NOP2/sun family [Candidatus Amesbacteria bacterium GW2011_GWA2_42_12]|uniref:RNA methylase, NOL1/NOP2/sun family n=1 Tax=Candidatus Amesbacteria bacterium GW2011_GWA2_42_12 TaxID=1618356 RepID=A0A0G0Y296_9BACT|nr:MAG: RNA methylase, NOL1/NOP2/sun family [Candidatus Amesbacteria bacterium GW2011_GWA2_42_12]HLD37144.1 NOL1/NOP2/sun family putative RNA methylase [Candidatus Nanoarchaeia archaeon]